MHRRKLSKLDKWYPDVILVSGELVVAPRRSLTPPLRCKHLPSLTSRHIFLTRSLIAAPADSLRTRQTIDLAFERAPKMKKRAITHVVPLIYETSHGDMHSERNLATNVRAQPNANTSSLLTCSALHACGPSFLSSAANPVLQLVGAIMTFVEEANITAKTLMLVGHNDGFQALASLLRCAEQEMRRCRETTARFTEGRTRRLVLPSDVLSCALLRSCCRSGEDVAMKTADAALLKSSADKWHDAIAGEVRPSSEPIPEQATFP